MKESDWKVFVQIKEQALEKYCENVLTDSKNLIGSNAESNHEKFLDLYDLIKKTNRKIADMFDGHSRSGAFMQLLLIRNAGLANEKLIAQLTPEFAEETNPDRIKF